MISQESNWWVFAGCFLIWLAEPWAQCFYLPPSHGTIHTPNIGLLASLFAHLFKVKSTSMKTIVCTDLQTLSHCRDFNLSTHHWAQQIRALSVVLSTDKCGKVYQTCAFIIRRSADPNLQSGQGYIADRPCTIVHPDCHCFSLLTLQTVPPVLQSFSLQIPATSWANVGSVNDIWELSFL